jgi:hypothetical protein
LADAKAKLEAVKKFSSQAHGEKESFIMLELIRVPCLTQASLIAVESIGQLQKDIDAARESQRYAKSQHEAGRRVLT